MAITSFIFFKLLLPFTFSLPLNKFQEVQNLSPEKKTAILQMMREYDQMRTQDAPTLCEGRLTLTSNTPITTSNVTAATSIYFTPYNGNKISVYTGSRWIVMSFSQTTVSVPATTSTPFDIFGYNNSGVFALETVNWSNDTTRATGIVYQNGVYVKSGTTTRRYLGTARTTGVSGQTEDSTSNRLLWNSCNRFPRKLLAQTTTTDWYYTTQATWRAANGDTSYGSGRVGFVIGVMQEPVDLRAFVPGATGDTGGPPSGGIGIGINSTSSNSAPLYGALLHDSNNTPFPIQAFYRGYPSIGFSYAQWLEYFSVGGGMNLFAYHGTFVHVQSGLTGTIWQ